MARPKIKANKAQIKRRKTKRNKLRPIRMAWRIFLRKEVYYEMAELGAYPARIKVATRAKKGQAY